MKNILLFSILLISPFFGFGQCPNTNIVLATQAEIDNFSVTYPNCTQLTHELKINGDNSSITNLNGLSAITDGMKILIINTEIQDFSGLHNLSTTTNLGIWFNPNIQNLDGLTALQTIGRLEIWINNAMLNLTGIDNIQFIGSLNLFENALLEDISELSFIDTLDTLVIGGNSLNNLSGLENLHTVQGDLSISNEQLQNFDELSNLQTIGGSLYLLNNGVQNLSAFSSIQTLEDLYVVLCPNLSDLSGLENIQTITGRLRIGFNPGLNDLTVFNSIHSVGNLDIYQNQNLQMLKGIENLQEVSGRVLIADNPVLSDITAIGGMSPQISELVISNNPNLSICKNAFVCAVVDDPTVAKFINNNNTGCNSVEEVEMACLLSVSEEVLTNSIYIYPNPVSEVLTISISENIDFNRASLFTILGQKLFESSEKSINISHLATGIYVVEVETGQGKITKKIVKE